MDVVKLGKKGQVSIPQSVLRRLGLSGEAMLLLDVSDDGAIVLRQAAVVPIELYSDERIEAFERANAVPDDLTRRVQRRLRRRAKAGAA